MRGGHPFHDAVAVMLNWLDLNLTLAAAEGWKGRYQHGGRVEMTGGLVPPTKRIMDYLHPLVNMVEWGGGSVSGQGESFLETSWSMRRDATATES